MSKLRLFRSRSGLYTNCMRTKKPSQDMVIDLVDSRNRPIGTIARRDIFTVMGGFRTVHVLIFNERGELLVQQQAQSRARAPLTWGSSVAGYLFAGESYPEAARRRVWQELGIKPGDLRLVDVVKVDDLGHDKFIGIVTGTSEGPFKIDKSQISQLRFMRLSDIQSSLENGTVAFSPAFSSVLNAFMNHHGANQTH